MRRLSVFLGQKVRHIDNPQIFGSELWPLFSGIITVKILSCANGILKLFPCTILIFTDQIRWTLVSIAVCTWLVYYCSKY